jgi:hypothetical protein
MILQIIYCTEKMILPFLKNLLSLFLYILIRIKFFFNNKFNFEHNFTFTVHLTIIKEFILY